MSKRILAVVLVLGTLVASNAFASRARVLTLGTGDAGVVLGNGGSTGSFYTDDAYNMFYNPVYVNDYKNWAIIEKSNFTSNGLTTTGSTAQGGFVTALGNFNLGLFFNRQDDLQDTIYGTASGSNNLMRPIDLLVGGDMNDIKWGLGLSYAGFTAADPSNAALTKTSNDWVLRAGISYMDFEPFVDWRISGTDNSVATAPKNKGLMAGLRYHWGEWTPYAVYKYAKYADVTVDRDYGIGFGRTMKASETVKLAYSLAWFRQTIGVNTGTSGAWNGTTTAGDRSVIPLNVSVEGDANSWLTLRAGLGYNFMDHVNSVTVADNTFGRVGATAHAGKVDFDFAVGQASGTVPANEGATDTNAQAFDFAHQFFTAASLQYHW